MKALMEDSASIVCGAQNDLSTTRVLSFGSCPEIPKDGMNQETRSISDASLRSSEQSQSALQKGMCVDNTLPENSMTHNIGMQTIVYFKDKILSLYNIQMAWVTFIHMKNSIFVLCNTNDN